MPIPPKINQNVIKAVRTSIDPCESFLALRLRGIPSLM